MHQNLDPIDDENSLFILDMDVKEKALCQQSISFSSLGRQHLFVFKLKKNNGIFLFLLNIFVSVAFQVFGCKSYFLLKIAFLSLPTKNI